MESYSWSYGSWWAWTPPRWGPSPCPKTAPCQPLLDREAACCAVRTFTQRRITTITRRRGWEWEIERQQTRGKANRSCASIPAEEGLPMRGRPEIRRHRDGGRRWKTGCTQGAAWIWETSSFPRMTSKAGRWFSQKLEKRIFLKIPSFFLHFLNIISCFPEPKSNPAHSNPPTTTKI